MLLFPIFSLIVYPLCSGGSMMEYGYFGLRIFEIPRKFEALHALYKSFCMALCQWHLNFLLILNGLSVWCFSNYLCVLMQLVTKCNFQDLIQGGHYSWKLLETPGM